jgi:hypothetical protein
MRAENLERLLPSLADEERQNAVARIEYHRIREKAFRAIVKRIESE